MGLRRNAAARPAECDFNFLTFPFSGPASPGQCLKRDCGCVSSGRAVVCLHISYFGEQKLRGRIFASCSAGQEDLGMCGFW